MREGNIEKRLVKGVGMQLLTAQVPIALQVRLGVPCNGTLHFTVMELEQATDKQSLKPLQRLVMSPFV